MATAVQSVRQVQKFVDEPMFVLTLTEDETKTLMLVLRRIGGDPHITRRGDTDAIKSALLAQGADPMSDSSSSCYFGNYDNALYFLTGR